MSAIAAIIFELIAMQLPFAIAAAAAILLPHYAMLMLI